MSVGAAWIQTEDGEFLYKSKFEPESTSQRGEIWGLIEALTYAIDNAKLDEHIIIVTDSQYLYNTVTLGWCFKWRESGWFNADGQPTKNSDLWQIICQQLDRLNFNKETVFMEWTKGHRVHCTKGNAKKAMKLDPTGVELYGRMVTLANRVADKDNIIKNFNKERNEHSCMIVPEDVALEWAIANAMADGIAFYIVNTIYDATATGEHI